MEVFELISFTFRVYLFTFIGISRNRFSRLKLTTMYPFYVMNRRRCCGLRNK